MKKFIQNYDLVDQYLNTSYSWFYDEIIGLSYELKNLSVGSADADLILLFKVTSYDCNDEFVVEIRCTNVSDLSLNKVSRILLGGLIIKECGDNSWEDGVRLHVHDDCGYGVNDGFQFIEFNCKKMEVLSVAQLL